MNQTSQTPDVSEDGILINPDMLKRFSFKTYNPRVIEWGNRRFPLNLYEDIPFIEDK